MVNFGFIGEGICDFYVIQRILAIYYNPDILVRSLNPTIQNRKQINYSGWQKVFEYCKSNDLIEFLNDSDDNYIIVHIDTDIAHEKGYDIIHDTTKDKNGNQLRLDVIKKFFSEIFVEELNKAKYQDKIIFAITIKKMECWLLPNFTAELARLGNINNCDNNLKTALRSNKEKINLDQKNVDDYIYMAKKFSNKRDLISKSKHNISFKKFIEDLPKIIEDENSNSIMI